MADTIREFLIGLGFKLDEAGERRFVSMIEGATLRANLLADAIENMARVVVDKVAVVAENFEQLYYQSQRIGASANSIEAFAFTVHKLGGTVEGAKSSLQGFGDFLNNHIGAAGALAKQLGIPLKDTADRGLFLLEVGEKLSKMPKYLATQYRETFHLGDYDTIAAAGRAGGRDIYTGDIKNRENSGIGAQTTKDAVRLEQALKDLNEKLDIYYTQAESSLFKHSANMIEELNKYLENHKKKISEFVDWLTNLGLFSDAGKTSLHFDEKKFGEHFEKALSAAETATVTQLKHLEDALHPVVVWFERFGRTLAGWFTQPHLNPDGTPEILGGGESDGGGGGGGLWGRVKRFFGAGGAPAGLRARAVGGAPTGNEAVLAKQAYDYWRGQGLSHDQALSVVGNQRGEQALGGLVHGDGGSASGQFQWHADRVADILRNTGIDVRTAGFLDQQKAARWEFEHGAGGGHIWNALKNAKSREEAIWLLVHNFERSGDQRGDAAIRLGHTARYGRIIPPDSAKAPTGSVPAGWSDPAHHSNGLSDPINPGFTRAWEEGKFREGIFAPQAWDHGHQWDKLNASLPVGSATTNDNSKSVTSSVTNNVTVNAPDPHSAAAMVGLHLDRSANDLARNLQGAHQ